MQTKQKKKPNAKLKKIRKISNDKKKKPRKKNKELEKILREIDSTSAKMIIDVSKKEIPTNSNKKDKTKKEIAMADKMIERIEIKEVEAETEKKEADTTDKKEEKKEVETKEDMAVEVNRITTIIHNHNNNRMVDITEVTEDIITTIMVITTETTTTMNRIITTIWFKKPNLSKKENPFLSLLLNQLKLRKLKIENLLVLLKLLLKLQK